MMDVAAVNVTAKEMMGIERKLKLGELVETGDSTREDNKIFLDQNGGDVQFISANIVDEETEETFFRPYIIIEQGDKKIGVVGITDSAPRTWEAPGGRKLKIADPVESIRPIFAKLSKETDLIILLANIQRWKIRGAAETLSGEIERNNGDDGEGPRFLILAADGITTTAETLRIGDALISYCGRQGQNVGLLYLELTENGKLENLEHEIVRLDTDMPEDDGIKEIVEQAKKEVAEITKR